MDEQIALFDAPPKKRKTDPKKRAWENAFQRWCDEISQDGYSSLGCCGWGDICDYCKDNYYGRPCVRALNEYCKAKNKRIDYNNRDFIKIWRGKF